MNAGRRDRTRDRTIVVCKYQPELLAALLDHEARTADVCLVIERSDVLYESPDPALLGRCRKVYTVSGFDSLAELSAVAVDLRQTCPPVVQVHNQDERSQFGSGYLRLLLDPSAPGARHHVALRDKRLMKELVGEAGVAVTRFRSLADPQDADAVAAVARELAAPLIVKPVAGYGASATEKVECGEELGAVAAGLKFEVGQRAGQLMVEEFVPGEELAVDAIWSGGEPLTFVVHRYLYPRMQVLGGALDGSLILAPGEHPGLYARIKDMHKRFNPALGIHDGPSHLEVFVREDGELVFSEVAARPGGGWIQLMIGAYHGRSTSGLIAEAAHTGSVTLPGAPWPHIGGLHIRPSAPGVIVSMPDDDELAAFPGAVAWHRRREAGDRARISGPSDWYFHLVLGADTEEGLFETCERAARTFTVQTAESAPPVRGRAVARRA
ncbi:ATP-grasp domain-containing protein (plasmid) [Streptomyces sp. NBC_00441]|uniref:ATP-grasp domain-containing protein n=1 Tax=Streptomyces sp. NBC_00441 TaxID=2975742 RepID=UPI002E2E788B|nr:ATP-grasp domain-containing protein [Streptomyces sp. NBC_00441]